MHIKWNFFILLCNVFILLSVFFISSHASQESIEYGITLKYKENDGFHLKFLQNNFQKIPEYINFSENTIKPGRFDLLSDAILRKSIKSYNKESEKAVIVLKNISLAPSSRLKINVNGTSVSASGLKSKKILFPDTWIQLKEMGSIYLNIICVKVTYSMMIDYLVCAATYPSNP